LPVFVAVAFGRFTALGQCAGRRSLTLKSEGQANDLREGEETEAVAEHEQEPAVFDQTATGTEAGSMPVGKTVSLPGRLRRLMMHR
jgi:hypothetical protein